MVWGGGGYHNTRSPQGSPWPLFPSFFLPAFIEHFLSAQGSGADRLLTCSVLSPLKMIVSQGAIETQGRCVRDIWEKAQLEGGRKGSPIDPSQGLCRPGGQRSDCVSGRHNGTGWRLGLCKVLK